MTARSDSSFQTARLLAVVWVVSDNLTFKRLLPNRSSRCFSLILGYDLLDLILSIQISHMANNLLDLDNLVNDTSDNTCSSSSKSSSCTHGPVTATLT
eukprot:850402-Amorphochlora_amoeboformis.AAC.1